MSTVPVGHVEDRMTRTTRAMKAMLVELGLIPGPGDRHRAGLRRVSPTSGRGLELVRPRTRWDGPEDRFPVELWGPPSVLEEGQARGGE